MMSTPIRWPALVATVALALMLSAAHAIIGNETSRAETDELARLGLPPDTGRDEVEAYCGGCHSLRLVVQQGLSREAWQETIEWMVEEQAMEPMEPDDHKLVLDYLAKHVSIEANLKRRKQ